MPNEAVSGDACAADDGAVSPTPGAAYKFVALDGRDESLLDEVVALVNLCYRGSGSWTGERDIVRGERITRSGLDAVVADASAHVVVALACGGGPRRVLACVRTGIVTHTVAGPLADPPAAYLGMLAVHPDAQSCRIGTALVQEVERRARDVYACSRVVMDVLDCRQKLIHWYNRIGFKPTGQLLPADTFMRDKGEELLVPCSFILLEKYLEPR